MRRKKRAKTSASPHMLVLLIQVPGTWAVLRLARWHVKWQAAVDVKLDTVVYASDRRGRCLVLWLTLVITNTVCSQIGAPLHRAAIAARAARRGVSYRVPVLPWTSIRPISPCCCRLSSDLEERYL